MAAVTAVALFESSHGQHIQKVPSRGAPLEHTLLRKRAWGLSRGLTNSPLDCLSRRCGAVALFDSSHGNKKIT